jgi:uncharacterized protein YacL
MADIIQIVLLTTILIVLITRELRFKDVSRAKHGIILDSCGLIDGRILELTELSLINGTIIIPQFILDELQLLADGHDTHKRERARFGLEIANQLRKLPNSTVVLDDTKLPYTTNAVDTGLISLAKKRNAKLYTTDYNLNKRAEVEGVAVINIHKIAEKLRPVALPGEQKKVKILKKGDNRDQGVGYLEDGTMVVVEGAARQKGKTIEVSVTQVHQTLAGRMMFAKYRG